MAFTLISSTKITPVGTNGGTSPAIDTTGADLIIFSFGSRYLFAPTPSDSQSNTWSRATHIGDPGITVQNVIDYCFNPTTSASHTFTIDGGGGGGAASCGCIEAWSGSASLEAAEDTAGYNAGTTVQPGSMTAAGSGRLYVTSLSSNYSGTPTIDSGFTIQESVPYLAGNNYGNALAHIVQGAASALNPTWTDTGTPGFLLATMAIFAPATTASPFNRGYIIG